MRVKPKDGQQQMTVIRMAANCVARATNCHLTNTPAMSAVSARIVATVRNHLRRRRYLSHSRHHWHHRHRPDHQYLDPIHRDQ